MNEIAMKLQAPFAEKDYEWRVQSEVSNGKAVRVLCYVQARAIQNRLDEVMGPFGWMVGYEKGPDGGVICLLSLRQPDEKGYASWVGKEDGAENTAIEAVKGGISSALKRAGVAWGIGRLLYDLDATVVPLKSSGQYYHKTKDGWKYWDAPRLPDWAVAGRSEDKPQAPPEIGQQPGKPAPNMVNLKGEQGEKFLNGCVSAKAALAKMAVKCTVTDEAKKHVEDWYDKRAQEARDVQESVRRRVEGV